MFGLRYELMCLLRSPMFNLSTLAGLLEHRHRLDACCPRCDRWAEIDLAAMVAAGYGARRLPARVRCRNCSEVGRLLRPEEDCIEVELRKLRGVPRRHLLPADRVDLGEDACPRRPGH